LLAELLPLGGSNGTGSEIRDNGEIAYGLSDSVALLGDCQSAGRNHAARIAEFGFTPASRSHISAPPANDLPLLQLTMLDYNKEPQGGGSVKSLGSSLMRTGGTSFRDFFLAMTVFGRGT
jgi:hypothetical protein